MTYAHKNGSTLRDALLAIGPREPPVRIDPDQGYDFFNLRVHDDIRTSVDLDAELMKYSYPAFVFKQRADGNGPTLALFHAPAGDVLAWADVDRLGPDNRLGPQREPNKSHNQQYS